MVLFILLFLFAYYLFICGKFNASNCESVVGTNLGAALVDVETGMTSWVLRSKSDVMALQLVHSVSCVFT